MTVITKDGNNIKFFFAIEDTPFSRQSLVRSLKLNSIEYKHKQNRASRRTFGNDRMELKGDLTSVDDDIKIAHDLTVENSQYYIPCVLYTSLSEQPKTHPFFGTTTPITSISVSSGNGLIGASGGGLDTLFKVRDLLEIKGAPTAANNRLVQILSLTSTQITLVNGLVDDAVGSDTVISLTRVGHSFGTGKLSVTRTGRFCDLVLADNGEGTWSDYKLELGQSIILDAEEDQSSSHFDNNRGRGRIHSIINNGLTLRLDSTDWTPVTESGSGKTIRVFFSTEFIKNRSTASSVENTFTSLVTVPQAIYSEYDFKLGNAVDSYKITVPEPKGENAKITADIETVAVKPLRINVGTASTGTLAVDLGRVDKSLLVNNSGGYASGVSTINIDGGAANAQLFVGDRITFSNHATRYIVTNANTANGSGAFTGVQFTPALTQSITDNLSLTVVAGYATGVSTVNLDAATVTGSIVKGDKVTFAGHSQVYTVTNFVNAASNLFTGVQITPSLVSEVGNNEVATMTFTARPVLRNLAETSCLTTAASMIQSKLYLKPNDFPSTPNTPNPTDIIAHIKNHTIDIKHNVEVLRSEKSRLYGFDFKRGDMQFSGSMTAYYENIDLENYVEANSSFGFYNFLGREKSVGEAGTGIVYDFPHITLDTEGKSFNMDGAMEIDCNFKGVRDDETGCVLAISYFSYFPRHVLTSFGVVQA